jgi:hypothetical protein
LRGGLFHKNRIQLEKKRTYCCTEDGEVRSLPVLRHSKISTSGRLLPSPEVGRQWKEVVTGAYKPGKQRLGNKRWDHGVRD